MIAVNRLLACACASTVIWSSQSGWMGGIERLVTHAAVEFAGGDSPQHAELHRQMLQVNLQGKR